MFHFDSNTAIPIVPL